MFLLDRNHIENKTKNLFEEKLYQKIDLIDLEQS